MKIPSALPFVYEFVGRDGSGCLEVDGEDNREHIATMNGKASGKSQPTSPIYRIGGRECSDIVPGNEC